MGLKAGPYKITSKATEGLISRALFEDLSLMPKRVVALGKDVTDRPPWHIIPVEGDEDAYILLTMGARAFERDGKVWADMLNEDKTLWAIRAQPQHGENVYTITTPKDPFIGWSVPERELEDPQVEVKPLPATKSLPPHFLPSALYEIVHLLED